MAKQMQGSLCGVTVWTVYWRRISRCTINISFSNNVNCINVYLSRCARVYLLSVFMTLLVALQHYEK